MAAMKNIPVDQLVEKIRKAEAEMCISTAPDAEAWRKHKSKLARLYRLYRKATQLSLGSF